MRINTNVSALNTQRNLGATGADAAKYMARLSSGFRINSAADDAAGLAVANKMRADLRGMSQASRNAEQANGLLQVAEGATNVIQSIVDRMKELTVQATSDNVDDTARAKIQQEFSQLQSEITRTAATTKFNGQTLIDGTFGNKLTTGTTSLIGVAGVSAGTITLSGAKAATYGFTLDAGKTSVTLDDGAGNKQTIGVAAGAGVQTWNFNQFGVSVKTSNLTAEAAGALGNVVVGSGAVSFTVSVSGGQGAGGAAGNDDVALSTVDLSLTTLGLNADDLTSKSNAQTALGHIDTAIGTISTALGNLGAAQNRITFASQNVKSAIQNVSAAESTIRDADMAEEMSNFSKTQILQQAGVAMLAQANQAPQLVLKLLG